MRDELDFSGSSGMGSLSEQIWLGYCDDIFMLAAELVSYKYLFKFREAQYDSNLTQTKKYKKPHIGFFRMNNPKQ